MTVRVGVIGLGAGTLATYGRKGDVYRFYEINPQVVDLAIEAAGRLLATQMDEKKQRQLVEEYLEKLPKEARV